MAINKACLVAVLRLGNDDLAKRLTAQKEWLKRGWCYVCGNPASSDGVRCMLHSRHPNRQNQPLMRRRRQAVVGFLALVFVLLLSARASAEMWIEIKLGPNRNDVLVRVMDSQFLADLYWIDRSNDGGRTWTPYMPVINGEWRLVGSRPAASLFRSRYP
jgi:hypothetical protein